MHYSHDAFIPLHVIIRPIMGLQTIQLLWYNGFANNQRIQSWEFFICKTIRNLLLVHDETKKVIVLTFSVYRFIFVFFDMILEIWVDSFLCYFLWNFGRIENLYQLSWWYWFVCILNYWIIRLYGNYEVFNRFRNYDTKVYRHVIDTEDQLP